MQHVLDEKAADVMDCIDAADAGSVDEMTLRLWTLPQAFTDSGLTAIRLRSSYRR